MIDSQGRNTSRSDWLLWNERVQEVRGQADEYLYVIWDTFKGRLAGLVNGPTAQAMVTCEFVEKAELCVQQFHPPIALRSPCSVFFARLEAIKSSAFVRQY